MWSSGVFLLSSSVFAQEPLPVPDAPPAAQEMPPLVKEPSLTRFVEAPYPTEALESEVEGTVLLLVTIDDQGKVTQVDVLRSGGHGFDEAAVTAAQQFQFEPALDATGPVPVAIEFEYGFRLPEAPPPADLEGGPKNLEGTIIERGTARPIEGLTVTLDEGPLTARTDGDGQFAFHGVPVGAHRIQVVQPGYDSAQLDLVVDEGQVTSVKLWIRNQSYRDDELIGVYDREREEVTQRTLRIDEVRRIPGTFGDPVRVIQTLPGAARSPFGTGLLIIRGANPEDSPVYVDGIRIPFIYHLGGYSSVLNADLVEAVDYLPGGYSVRYGRSTGGVVDVKTKTTFPEQHRITWTTDLLDSGGLYAGRVGKDARVGLALAARRSYVDAFIPLFTKESGWVIKPRWYDYQAKVADLGMDQGVAELFVFGFQDILRAESPEGVAQGTDQDTQGNLGTVYSTHRALVKWEKPLGEQVALEVTPSFGIDYASFSLGEDFHIDQSLYLAEARIELPWTLGEALELTPGLDFFGIYYEFTSEFPLDPGQLGSYDPLAEREPWTIEGDGWVWSPDVFLDAALRPFTDRERLLIKPGVRLNTVEVTGQYSAWSIDPRLLFRLQATPSGVLKGGTGLYQQPPQPFESWRPDGNVDLGFERAWATEVGWEQQLSEAIHADLTVFMKELDQLIVANPAFDDLDDPYYLNSGLGRVRGLELLARHEPIGPLFGWVSYTLSESIRKDSPDQAWYPFSFDQTHILTALAGYDLPRDFGVSGKVQYVTGTPFTPYAGGVYDVDQDLYFPYASGEVNAERLAPYFALDLRADKLLTFKRWQLELYLDLLNVLRGENPEFNIYNYDYTESRYIRGLPFIPSPGFEAKVAL